MEQNEQQAIFYYQFKASMIMPDIDFMDEYFGLGAQFFSTEVHYLHDIYYSKGKPIPDSLDIDVTIPIYFKSDIFVDLFQRAGIDQDVTMENESLFAFYLFTNLIYGNGYEDGIQTIIDSIDDETLQYRQVRKDLLKLYLFINDPCTKPDKPISIQHLTGTVKLDNSFGWFTRRLLTEYLAEYLPDITSLEQAKQELDGYKKQAGRKSADGREQVLIYGLYRIIHEHSKMDSDLPDKLCEFIFEYLKLVKVYDDEEVLDMSIMRPTIRYIIKKPEQPKFGFSGKIQVLSREEVQDMKTKLY